MFQTNNFASYGFDLEISNLFRILKLEFRICFGLRSSDFGFMGERDEF